jgi:pseudaminic acid biosynthesis-associated methylase
MTKRIQDIFWTEEYADSYILKNSAFDNELGRQGWAKILDKADLAQKNYLELGCNIDRNLDQLRLLDPSLKPSVIEINSKALDFVRSKHELQQSFCGPVQEADFPRASFELVFTCGVLIHIPPEELLDVMAKMHKWSSKFIVISEYFNRTPVSIEYQGRSNLLFKRDFGAMFADNFDVSLVDYGFLWGRIFDAAGFDDVTWWLFDKNVKSS